MHAHTQSYYVCTYICMDVHNCVMLLAVCKFPIYDYKLFPFLGFCGIRVDSIGYICI